MEARFLNILQSKAEVFECDLVCIKTAAVRSSNEDVLRNQIYELLKLSFVLTDPLYGQLSVLDIDTRSVPFNDVSQIVVKRYFPVQEPAIFPISAPHACLCL